MPHDAELRIRPVDDRLDGVIRRGSRNLQIRTEAVPQKTPVMETVDRVTLA